MQSPARSALDPNAAAVIADSNVKNNYKWLVLTIVSLGTAMSALDTGVVNVAYPEMTRFFNVPLTTITWVSLAYLIVSSATITTFGRMADLFGRKWIYVGGLAVFCIGSLVCAFAPTIWLLLVGRVIEALGAAMALSNSIALISEVFPAQQRGMAIGVLETAVGVALTLGPTLGALLIGLFGWSAVFFLNLPLGMVNIGLGLRFLRNSGHRQATTNLDLTGTFSFGGSVALLLLGLTQGQSQGWLSGFTLGVFGLSLVLLTFFIYWERRVANPAIDLKLFFANRAFALANFTKILGYMAFFGINFLLPYYLEIMLNFDTKVVGAAIIPFTAGMLLGSLSSSFLSDRYPSRWLTALGLGMVAASGLLLGLVGPAAGYWPLLPGMALGGIGMGLFITPNDKTIMNAAPSDRMGVAGSTLALTRSLGIISGITLAGTLFAALTDGKPGADLNKTSAPMAFSVVYVIIAAIALVGALVTGTLQSSTQASE